jgi:hypothetical protein
MQGRSPAGTSTGHGQGNGLSLPTESLDGTSATELVTELGTVLEFSDNDIHYLVFGSVPLGTANAVARAL